MKGCWVYVPGFATLLTLSQDFIAFLHSSLNLLNFFVAFPFPLTSQLWDFYVSVERKTSVIYGITRHWPSLSKVWNLHFIIAKLFYQKLKFCKETQQLKDHYPHTEVVAFLCHFIFSETWFLDLAKGSSIVKEAILIFFYKYFSSHLYICMQTLCSFMQSFIISCRIVANLLNGVSSQMWAPTNNCILILYEICQRIWDTYG